MMPIMTTTHLLYLHGFRSSPQSTKARMVRERLALRHPGVTLWCPQLPPSPREAMAMLQEGIVQWPVDHMAVMGSSLGGFYATVLAENTGCPAAVLNPAIDPARDLANHVGEQSIWGNSESRFQFEPAFVDELRAMTPRHISRAGHYFALIAKGDEVLDWREMADRYAGANLKILEGSDHALSDFALHIDEVLAFLQLIRDPAQIDTPGRSS